MANLWQQQPNPFNVHNPDEWTKWKRWYEQVPNCPQTQEHRQNTPGVQSALLHGEETAEDVLTSMGISDKERKRYDEQVQLASRD